MKFVAVFASAASLAAFRRAELLAVAETLRLDVAVAQDIPWLSGVEDECFCVFDASLEAARQLAERCMLLRGIYLLLRTAPSLELLTDTTSLTSADADYAALSHVMLHHKANGQPAVYVGEAEGNYLEGDYCHEVETIAKRYTAAEKQAIVQALLASPYTAPSAADHADTPTGTRRGAVSFTAPVHRFVVFVQHAACETPPRRRPDWRPNGALLRVLYTREMFLSRRTARLREYALQRRPYVGTTSMPPEEAFVMVNFARLDAARRPLVYDPFCGTGSLLVAAAAAARAHTFGSDADGRAMKGGSARSQQSAQLKLQRRLALDAWDAEVIATRLSAQERAAPTMRSNFALYGLPAPECLRLNFATWPSVFRTRHDTARETHTATTRREEGECTTHASGGSEVCGEGMFDCILTDPPYGLREARRPAPGQSQSNSGTNSATALLAPSEQQHHHHHNNSHAKEEEEDDDENGWTSDFTLDLVLFAAEQLRLGGHLCFWYATSDAYTPAELPSHPSLTLVQDLPQRLSLKVVRHLIVLRKTARAPWPRLTRRECAPQRRPARDLRSLLDATELPENAAYTHYRAKQSRKYAAVARFHRAQEEVAAQAPAACPNSSATGAAAPATTDDVPRRRRKRLSAHRGPAPSQDEIVRRRMDNLAKQKEKQAASSVARPGLASASHQERDES